MRNVATAVALILSHCVVCPLFAAEKDLVPIPDQIKCTTVKARWISPTGNTIKTDVSDASETYVLRYVAGNTKDVGVGTIYVNSYKGFMRSVLGKMDIKAEIPSGLAYGSTHLDRLVSFEVESYPLGKGTMAIDFRKGVAVTATPTIELDATELAVMVQEYACEFD